MVGIDKGKSVLCQDLLRIKSWPRTFLCYPQLNGIVAKFGFVVVWILGSFPCPKNVRILSIFSMFCCIHFDRFNWY